jgi:Tc toxin complex TcA C-terminal TcB-binding domain
MTMESAAQGTGVFHNLGDISLVRYTGPTGVNAGAGRTIRYQETFTYNFEDFFHPFLAQLINRLNLQDVAGMLDPDFLGGLTRSYVPSDYTPLDSAPAASTEDAVTVTIESGQIDVSPSGPYANYNWELLYHIPVMIAVHLSNNQRFAEAQQWFHLVFDPTNTDTSVPTPQRFWKSYVFRADGGSPVQSINSLLELLSDAGTLDSAQTTARNQLITGYNAILNNPFDPHLVAQTRPSAYQWYVVMKYLDNLIAWGDSLFTADTNETINEATLCYVLAAEVLGPRPQPMPQPDAGAPKNFRQLKQAGLDQMSNAMVQLESQFPFNLIGGPGGGGAPGTGSGGAAGDQSGALFGMGRSLYFCVPQNQTLLAYWDTVADRLFKIRNSENIQGVVQQLPLFDPPLDPGMLVQAAAAGISIGSIVSGLSQPLGPVRAPLLIQKSLELAAEVRALGSELLASLEKGDAEQLALLRQGHEVKLQQMTQEVRFLQWRQAQEATNILLKSRAVAYERYANYLRLLNLTPDADDAPADFTADRVQLTEENFASVYSSLVGKYDLDIADLAYNPQQAAQGASPASKAGATGTGQMYLNTQEDAEINTFLPNARDYRQDANIANAVAAGVTPVPSAEAHLAFWGMGIHSFIFGGSLLGELSKLAAEILNVKAGYNSDQAGLASRTASYQRRADEWVFQANLAARELMQIGRQIISALIAEQVVAGEYETVKTQVAQARETQAFLQNKFTSAVFYSWMQSDLSGLYYQYYRFACDTARQAEQTMKQELMRPELDATTFIQFNYWDAGRKGLLSGEALFLDVKRMELAYHDSNKRELELTRHVSLRQLDPLALLNLRISGRCTVTVPEWLYDRDCPGHYMRRIKTLSISVPSVAGPYTTVNLTASLQSSSVRVSPLLAANTYARSTTQDDDRFVDYFGSTDVIVTSSGSNDSGMFETNLRDERFLPFEGAGAISTWNLSLPAQLPSFDYTTTSDVILHIRYTARMAGDPLGAQSTKELVAAMDTAGATGQSLLLCLRYDFPTQWAAFINGGSSAQFQATLTKQMFPYAVQSAKMTVTSLTLYTGTNGNVVPATPAVTPDMNTVVGAMSTGLNSTAGEYTLTLPSDPRVLVQDQTRQVFLVVDYTFKVS